MPMTLPRVAEETAVVAASKLKEFDGPSDFIYQKWDDMQSENPMVAQSVTQLCNMIAGVFFEDSDTEEEVEMKAQKVLENHATIPVMAVTLFVYRLLSAAGEIAELEE